MTQEPHIILNKELRRDIDAIIQRLKSAACEDKFCLPSNNTAAGLTEIGRRSRERSLAITKLQEAAMWLDMDLKAINDENPALPVSTVEATRHQFSA